MTQYDKFKQSIQDSNAALKDSWQMIKDIWGPGLVSLWNKLTGAGMTGAEKEAADTSLRNQQILADDDFQRKIDFFERYESIPAQVRQYKEAGLNVGLMYGNGASVSASGGIGAGSASAQSMGIGDLLGTILGFATKQKQLRQDMQLTSSAQDIQRYQAETARMQAQNYGAYLSALTQGQQNINDTFYSMFGLKAENLEADTAQKRAQSTYLQEVAASEPVRRQLMESGIELNDSQTAINEVQKAILAAMKTHSERYYKAVADIASYQANIVSVDSDIATRLSKNGNDLLYHRAVAECANIIFEAGMQQDIWEGDAFKASVSGTMTKKDWTQSILTVLKTLIGAGAVAGAAAIRTGAKAVVPPMTPGMTMQAGAYSNPYAFMPPPGV